MRNLFFLLLTTTLSCSTKQSIDTERLTLELDSILVADQKYRAQMQDVRQEYGWNSQEMGELWQKQQEVDESNLSRVLEIIELINGYPGKSLVGQYASEATFYVLQHAPDSTQEKYYKMIIDAARENELDKRLAAMYQDRYLMHRGKPQRFGTQIRTEYQTDSLTGERIANTFVWPIADTSNIDSLRLWNGMGPLEEYLNSHGISRWNP